MLLIAVLALGLGVAFGEPAVAATIIVCVMAVGAAYSSTNGPAGSRIV